MSAAVTFAFAGGLLATVNPCGFAMLPSFLSLYVGRDEHGAQQSLLVRLRTGFAVGLTLSASFGAALILAGLLMSVGLRAIIDVVPWVAVVIGAVLVVLGLAVLAGRHVGVTRLSRLSAGQGEAGGYRRAALFGLGYAGASLGCTLPVFLVVVSQAAAVGAVQSLVVFGAYAAGGATILIALGLSAAVAQGLLARGLRRLLPFVSRLGGALLAASGLYLVLYWLPVLGRGSAGASDSWAANATRRVVSTLQTFFAGHVGVFALALAALALLGVALLGLSARARRRDELLDHHALGGSRGSGGALGLEPGCELAGADATVMGASR